MKFLVRAAIFTLALRVFFCLTACFIARVSLEDTGTIWQVIEVTSNRWDGLTYEHIATLGAYNMMDHEGGALVFFPLYPLVVSRVMALGLDFYWASFVLSLATQVAAGYLLQRLVALDHAEPIPYRAMAAFYLFPTAYFLMAPYTEGLFLTLILGSLVAAREKAWAWAGAAAFGAALCRVVGIGLWPALWWEARRTKAGATALAWGLLCPLGLAGYLALNWLYTGHPFFFLWAEQHLFNYQREWPWVTFWQRLRGIWSSAPTPDAWAIEVPHVIGLSASYAVLGWVWLKRVRPSYQIFCWAALIPATLSHFCPSLLRYLLPAFPLYMLVAETSDEVYLPWLGVSTLLMGAMSVAYLRGYWAN